jgi:hypothetical protein
MVKGMKEATGELVRNKTNEVLKVFCIEAEPRVCRLQEDFETSRVNFSVLLNVYSLSLFLHIQEAFSEVVQFFGCNSKTTQPNVVFPILDRFVEGFHVSSFGWLHGSIQV